MKFKIVTLFPDFFSSPLGSGLLGKAVESGIIGVTITDIRNFATDRYRSCDDYPYGGGSGMVLMPGPLNGAIESVKEPGTRVILTSASGRLLNQDLVKELTAHDDLCIVCGHYEGVDQRVIDRHVDYEISIGDYVLSGGEIAALALLDACVRLIPGVMGAADSGSEESFENGLLEYPHYTRPREWEGREIPEILLSGDHGKIARWRRAEAERLTGARRPDLLKK